MINSNYLRITVHTHHVRSCSMTITHIPSWIKVSGKGISQHKLKQKLIAELEELLKIPLPCPFCGVTPSVLPEDPSVEGNAWGVVHCYNTLCAAQPTVSDGVTICDERGSDAYKAVAVLRWNTRSARAQ